MARNLFVNLTSGTFVASPTNPRPLARDKVYNGDSKVVNLYFVEETDDFQAPLTYVDKTAASVKFGIGNINGEPTAGTWTLTYGANTATGLAYNITAAELSTALNALASITSAGGVTVSGSIETHFQIRFVNVGARTDFTADTTLLTPDTTIDIDERVAGDGSTRELVELHLETDPAIYQDTWSDISTTVTATVATTTGGSSTASEVQTITFNVPPVTGTVSVTMPTDTRSVSSITAGVVTCTANHGLAIGQPVSFASSNTPSGYTDGTVYYVVALPNALTFTFSATSGGSAITGASAVSSTLNTIAETSPQLDYNFSPAELQSALESMLCIGSGNIGVTGTIGERFTLSFTGEKALANFPDVTTTLTGVAGAPGKTATVNYSTYAARDLLGDEASVAMTNEIKLSESGSTDTVLQQTVVITKELIRSGTMAPAKRAGEFRYSKVDISNGATSVAVTFSPAMTSAPTVVNVSIGVPSSISAHLAAVVDLSTLATTGFTALLSGAAPNGNYDLYYQAIV